MLTKAKLSAGGRGCLATYVIFSPHYRTALPSPTPPSALSLFKLVQLSWNHTNAFVPPLQGYYFCGDGARRDEDGYIWITGRVDDVLNVSGHRVGTAEVENALTQHPLCAEAAVVGCAGPLID